jgi:phosphate transport system substrate-binding protein
MAYLGSSLTHAAFAALLGTAAASAQDAPLSLHGGGSTFAAPAHRAWIEDYRAAAPTVEISYASIGSGDGIAGFLDGSLDFAATDAPLTGEQEAQVPGRVLHVPVTAGMVAVAYNLPGDLDGTLRLPRAVLGDIFAGAVTRWDDPRLVAANPGLDLPDRDIQIIARQDGSGTTFAFTNHLDAISERWREEGHGVAYQSWWPNRAMRTRGNEGVAATIMRAEGSIGYVEYGFARRTGLDMAAIENASGAFVSPSAESGAAAIATAVIPGDMKINLPDPAGAEAYPIVTFTWELLHEEPADAAKGAAIRDFTRWIVIDGQDRAAELGYVPMPEIVREKAAAALGAGL